MTGDLLSRLRGRIKHGLLTQEILDRIGRLGIWITPYVIVDESRGALMDYDETVPDCVIRPLLLSDMQLVADLPHRKRKLDDMVSRLDNASCLGIFVGDALAAYTWAGFDKVARAKGRILLHKLESDEAYLFDMYVDKNYRGMSLAPLLRYRMYQYLSGKGITKHYSITTYFNSASRKFKAKLGAHEFELRIGIRMWSLINADFLLRRYDADHPWATKRAYFV